MSETLLSCVRALVYDFLRNDPRFGRAVARTFYTEAVVAHRETLATVSFAKRFLEKRNLTLEDALRQAAALPVTTGTATASSVPPTPKPAVPTAATVPPKVAASAGNTGNKRVRSATPPPLPPAVTAPAKPTAAVPDSDDDDDVPASTARKPFNPSPSAAASGGGASAADASASAPGRTIAQNAQPFSSGSGAPKEVKHFSRIDISKVKFADPRLMDNSPGAEATAFRQNQEMMRVRGKEFSKHKQKNKSKLYAAGVVQDVRSFKLADD